MSRYVVKAFAALALSVGLAACQAPWVEPDRMPCGLTSGAAAVGCVPPPGLSLSVTGLRGTGLIVHSSVLGDHVVQADGPHLLGYVAEGTPYTLTVTGQPTWPWQTCVLGAGATGTVSRAAAGVPVTCTTNAYALGGALTGIVGAGVTLRSGDDTLLLDAVGVFTFATPVASGDPWLVTTVSVDPTLACSIAGGAGTMAGADVSTVAVTCACAPDRMNCDGDAANGCEAPAGGGCPTCADGAKNQDETDVDCGGRCGPCAPGQACVRNSDCITESCSPGTLTCAP